MNDLKQRNRTVNWRKLAYFTLLRLTRGQHLGNYYAQFKSDVKNGIPSDTIQRLLIDLLSHCERSVPYYAEIMRNLTGNYHNDPQTYLRQFPVLTKAILRKQFNNLKSSDLARRHWYTNTSGGSTGEPVLFIQDWDYAARSGATATLYYELLGAEFGEPVVKLWASLRDIYAGSKSWKGWLLNRITNTIYLNASQMTPESMRADIGYLNGLRPKLIIGYVDSLYTLANFVEREHLYLVPQRAIISTAGTLYPFIRAKIEQIFQCKVYNHYGSREVSGIASELPGFDGLWIPPWGNYVEILDDNDNPVPDGKEGNIVVTLLTNFAMPLVRYKIEDRGCLAPPSVPRPVNSQAFQSITGRKADTFRNKNGEWIHGSYFRHLLFFRTWIEKYQVVQKDYSHILYRFVPQDKGPAGHELDEIATKTREIMGNDCIVDFDFVDQIPSTKSGKYRYTMCEILDQEC